MINLNFTQEIPEQKRKLNMNNSIDKFLLSMLLAIGELETPLNAEEKENFQIAAEQLELDPTAWSTNIEPNLIEIINSNLSLNRLFQDIKSKIDKIDNIPQDLIPKAEDLATVTPTKNQPLERPIPNISQGDLESNNEITNTSIQILSSSEPSETVKKISKLEKLKNWLSQNNSDNK